LLALAVDTLARAPDTALRHLSDTLVELVLGQADDLAFESRPWTGPQAVTLEEYERMAARKTGSLTGCAAALGAVLAGAPRPLVARMAAMGRRLGLAYQAVDDLLGLWGDPRATGKPVHNDLRRDKKTLPVPAALTSGGDAAAELAALLAGPEPAAPHVIAALTERTR
ncbi:MAG: polyprenyl synthetase family protein, partial [Nonomuraea sp.]|nr:polyprenyl synthetase family protein [Nonomuraea sp.]